MIFLFWPNFLVGAMSLSGRMPSYRLRLRPNRHLAELAWRERLPPGAFAKIMSVNRISSKKPKMIHKKKLPKNLAFPPAENGTFAPQKGQYSNHLLEFSGAKLLFSGRLWRIFPFKAPKPKLRQNFPCLGQKALAAPAQGAPPAVLSRSGAWSFERSRPFRWARSGSGYLDILRGWAFQNSEMQRKSLKFRIEPPHS